MPKAVWIDPSRLVFAVYRLLPFLYVVMCDEVQSNYEVPFLIISLATLSIGAVFYMRAKNHWQRLLSLYAGTISSPVLHSIAVMLY